jgi:hypothetical protein
MSRAKRTELKKKTRKKKALMRMFSFMFVCVCVYNTCDVSMLLRYKKGNNTK